jgi:glycosyltransferase involved in cell wall biosynthesis
MEAGYCGTPTLASRRGSLPEVVSEKKTGFLIEDFIEGTFMFEDCLKLDRQKIAETVRKRFNYQNMTRDYIHTYRKVIRNSKK